MSTSLALLLAASACGGSSGSSTATGPASAPASSSTGALPNGGGFGGGSSCAALDKTPSAAPASAVPTSDDSATVTDAVGKANAFLATLSADQKKTVLLGYTALDTKRCSWSNFPDGLFNGRLGVTLGDLDDEQKAAAYAVLESVLSADGFTQVQNEILGDEQLGASSGGAPGSFGEDYYHLVLFGTPSADSPWTLQFGGHHLAHHISIGGGALSVSPHFSGSQPISFTSGGKTIRPMGQETDDVFGLFKSLTSTQQAAAKLSGSLDDIVMGPGTDTGYPTQEGLACSTLDATQQGLVKAIIKDWVGDAADTISKPLLDLYDAQLSSTTISYTGNVDPTTSPAYFRIDGPRVWIEWISTSAAGFHYHTVYRDKALDYGTGTGS